MEIKANFFSAWMCVRLFAWCIVARTIFFSNCRFLASDVRRPKFVAPFVEKDDKEVADAKGCMMQYMKQRYPILCSNIRNEKGGSQSRKESDDVCSLKRPGCVYLIPSLFRNATEFPQEYVSYHHKRKGYYQTIMEEIYKRMINSVKTFEQWFECFLEFKKEKRDCDVPNRFKGKPGLGK